MTYIFVPVLPLVAPANMSERFCIKGQLDSVQQDSGHMGENTFLHTGSLLLSLSLTWKTRSTYTGVLGGVPDTLMFLVNLLS